MVEEIIIVNQQNFEEKKKKFQNAGKETIHVLSDFDKTLTKAYVNEIKVNSVIAQIRNGNYLTEDYSKKAHDLFDYYHPIEINPKISFEEKNNKMYEWWKKHFELLVECGLNKKTIEQIVKTKSLRFREKSSEFMDLLHQQKIPLFIMSAGPGDMISEYLKQEGRLYDNVKIIANTYKFDETGNALKIKEPIIHSLNKYEIILKEFPVYDLIKNRKNVLLLGDSLDDVGMIKGFSYDNLIKVGFLNENVEENLKYYKKVYDVLILNDSGMDFVNDLMKEILVK